MNRRESLKAIGLTTVSTGVLLAACKQKTDNAEIAGDATEPGREAFETARIKKLKSEVFFNAHEMATITILADIIIPKDDAAGSASDAKVPEFIEFIVKDMPEHQLPMRGGIRWLDFQSMSRYRSAFKDCTSDQRIELVEEIAYPAKAKPEMRSGVSFFSLMRDLTASGYFTTEIGIKYLGYVGNSPGKWEGVPADILKQYGMTNV